MSYFPKKTLAHYAHVNNMLALDVFDADNWEELNYCPSYFQKPCMTSLNDTIYVTESSGQMDNYYRVTICRLDASFVYNQWQVL
jgi:hypothetical protein